MERNDLQPEALPVLKTSRGMPSSVAHARSKSDSGAATVGRSNGFSAAACSTSVIARTIPLSGTLPMPHPIISTVDERIAEAGSVMSAPLELPSCTKRIGTPSGPALAATMRRSALRAQRLPQGTKIRPRSGMNRKRVSEGGPEVMVGNAVTMRCADGLVSLYRRRSTGMYASFDTHRADRALLHENVSVLNRTCLGARLDRFYLDTVTVYDAGCEH